MAGGPAGSSKPWAGTLIVMPSVIESQWMMEIARRTAVWHSDAGSGGPDSSDAPPEPLRVYDYKGLRWHREDAERKKVGKQSKRTQAQVRLMSGPFASRHRQL